MTASAPTWTRRAGTAKSASAWVIDGYAHIVAREFRGDALGPVACVSVRAGAVGVTFERCKFINCFRSLETLGGLRLKVIACEFIFERSATHPPSAALSQYHVYLAGGDDIEIGGCYAYGPRLEAFKIALATTNVRIAGCIAEECGVSPSEATAFGCTAQAGDSIDGYASAHVLRVTDHTARGCYGCALILKTNHALNPPNLVGDVQISSLYAEECVYGFAHEPIDALDTPSGPDFPGDRPTADRVVIHGLLAVRCDIGMLLNGRNLSASGVQIADARQHGVILYVSARDVDLIAPQVLRCSSGLDAQGVKYDLPGIAIKGARDFAIRGGVVDGGTGATHRSPIEVVDYDEAHAAGDFLIDDVRCRNWRASGSPPVMFAADCAGGIVRQRGAGSPTGSPGAHGSKGSRYLDTASGLEWRKTGAANDKAAWVQA